MTVLEFPNNPDGSEYYAFNEDAPLSDMDINYFPIKNMNGTRASKTVFDPSSIPPNNKYSGLKYIDLDQSLNGESRPFIESLKPFTIELKLSLHFDDNYFDKSRVFFAIGQYVAGKPGGVITVGTNANNSANKKKPILGMIDNYGVKKSLPIEGSSIEIDETTPNQEYTFKLVFNPQIDGANRVLLFMSNNTTQTTETLQTNGEGLSVNDNFNIAKPRLYLFTSGWTNEYGWNGKFDYAYGTLDRKNLKVYDNVVYSQDFLLNSLNNVQFEKAVLNHEEGIDVTSEFLSSESTIELYM